MNIVDFIIETGLALADWQPERSRLDKHISCRLDRRLHKWSKIHIELSRTWLQQTLENITLMSLIQVKLY